MMYIIAIVTKIYLRIKNETKSCECCKQDEYVHVLKSVGLVQAAVLLVRLEPQPIDLRIADTLEM